MADNRRRIRFKSIAILEAVIILLLIIALIFVGLIRGRGEAVPANANSDKPQVRRRAVIEKRGSLLPDGRQKDTDAGQYLRRDICAGIFGCSGEYH